MNLHFCDLCNESIPQADLDEGRAVRRNERLICRACEAAMSVPTPEVVLAPIGTSTERIAPPTPRAPAGTSPVLVVGLAFSSVALVLAAGSAVFCLSQFERRTRGLEARITALQQALAEPSRLEGALTEERLQREAGLGAVTQESRELQRRLDALERARAQDEELGLRVVALGERMSALNELEDRSDRQARTLEDLSAAVARIQGSLAAREAESAKPAAPVAAKEAPAATPTPPDAAWRKAIADLASPNSGTRWQAVQTLGASGDPSVVVHLLPMLDDTDIFVRMATTRVLGDLGSREAIPALIDTLEDEEASVREAALVALRALSRQNIPFDPMAREGDRSKRVKAWRDWWEQESKDQPGTGGAKAKG